MKLRCIAALLVLSLAMSTAFATGTGDGTGARKHGDTGVDSTLGPQASLTINGWLSGTLQGLVSKDGEDTVGAQLAWAFVRAQLHIKLSVRVRRMGLSVFMISGYLDGKSINAFNLVAESGPWTLRLGRSDAKVTIAGATAMPRPARPAIRPRESGVRRTKQFNA